MSRTYSNYTPDDWDMSIDREEIRNGWPTYKKKKMVDKNGNDYRTFEHTLPHEKLEEYGPRFHDMFKIDRDENGIMTAKWHKMGGPMIWDLDTHRGIWQLCKCIGQDEDTEVLIIGGEGDVFIDGLSNANEDKPGETELGEIEFEHMFMDGPRICEGLINDVAIPTIGVINGSGFHTEMALFCDITLIAEGSWISDMHCPINMVAGDGIQIALRNTMGLKRANYAMLTGEIITAEKALEIGMVNEIVPRDKIYERAHEIAEMIIKGSSRQVRRINTQIMRLPWRRAFATELWPAFGTEMFATVTCAQGQHDDKYWKEKNRDVAAGETQGALTGD